MPSESQQYHPYTFVDESATPEQLPGSIQPRPEGFVGPVFPYRGSQTHGVPPTSDYVGSPDNVEGGNVEVRYQSPEDDVTPVPVRIVDTAAHEYQQWRTTQTFAPPSPALVVNRKEGRKSLTIQNIGTVAVWVGPDSNVSKQSGYKVAANGGTFSLDGEAEVWACSDDTTTVPLCAFFEFGTPER